MKTVGQMLKEERKRRNLTVADVASVTKIHHKFLNAIEDGRYEIFASAVHLKGFIKSYAKALNLKEEEALALFRREYDEQKARVEVRNLIKPLKSPTPFWTPGMAAGALVGILILVFFAYLFWGYRTYAAAPKLKITSPSGNEIVATEGIIDISGETEKDVELKLNGQRIPIHPDGTFTITISLAQGANMLEFSAQNGLGKKATVKKTVIMPKTTKEVPKSRQTADKDQKEMSMAVEIGPNPAWILILTDEEKAFEGLVFPQKTLEFKAEEKIKLRTGNAGSTRVSVNNQDQGTVGREGEVVEKEFTK